MHSRELLAIKKLLHDSGNPLPFRFAVLKLNVNSFSKILKKKKLLTDRYENRDDDEVGTKISLIPNTYEFDLKRVVNRCNIVRGYDSKLAFKTILIVLVQR